MNSFDVFVIKGFTVISKQIKNILHEMLILKNIALFENFSLVIEIFKENKTQL